MVCLPRIFTYVWFLSHKHYFKVPLILCLYCLWSCSRGLESTVSLEVQLPGRFHLNHPAIKYFLPLSYLVIYHHLWSRVMYHPPGEAVNTDLCKQRGMTSIRALARPASKARGAPARVPALSNVPPRARVDPCWALCCPLFPGMALFCLQTKTLITLWRLWSSF